MNAPNPHDFKKSAKAAIHNVQLQTALNRLQEGLVAKRNTAIHAFDKYEAISDAAVAMKNEVLSNLDKHLSTFAKNVHEKGGHVHYVKNKDEACQKILALCQSINAKKITKSKSMITEEIALNDYLQNAGLKVIETDLGEYIIQLKKEAPSHIVLPAIHILKDEVSELFYTHHHTKDQTRSLKTPEDLLNDARDVLRQEFIDADVGITGANALIADTGTIMMMTNEGNGDLTQLFPKMHIVVASIEKVVPTFKDAMTIAKLLPRSATGQAITAYLSFTTGAKRNDEEDGPIFFHVILLDNGRREMIGTPFQDILRCIRCGACLNHCPVYAAVGGQSYGVTYPGPMGAALSPSLFGFKKTHHLPNASTFCGRCEAVCPMQIPLTTLMRFHRNNSDQHFAPKTTRFGLYFWAFFAKRPRLYHMMTAVLVLILKWISLSRGKISRIPFAQGFTEDRDLPLPVSKTFHQLWHQFEHKKDDQDIH